MNDAVQWAFCLLIGAGAVLYLLRTVGLFGRRGTSSGHCVKCHMAGRMVEALRRLDREDPAHD